jgi:WD40 repeat protein
MIGSHPDTIRGLSCAPNGLLVAASGFGEVILWDPTGGQLASFKASTRVVCWYGAMSSKGVVATAFGDCTLHLWKPNNNTHRKVATLGGIVASLAWSMDGERLFTGNCGDKTVRRWSAQGELIAEGKTKKSATWFVALTPDGRTGLSGSGDKLVHVWDATTCRETGTLVGHSGKILHLAVAGDGSTAASASQDRTARVWNLQTGQTVTVFDGHRKQVAWRRPYGHSVERPHRPHLERGLGQRTDEAGFRHRARSVGLGKGIVRGVWEGPAGLPRLNHSAGTIQLDWGSTRALACHFRRPRRKLRVHDRLTV